MSRMTRAIGFGFALAFLVASQPPSLGASDTSSDRLSLYMQRRAEAGFSGAVLVTRQAEVLLREGYGLAERELGVRNTPETVFRIGSVSKPLVATAVLKLVARGSLSLDALLSKYLPNCPPAWQQVRVQDLLSHTSGIPDVFGKVASGPPSQLRKLIDNTLLEMEDFALRSQPGSTYAYSNFGYLLLAYIIEIADQNPWFEVLRRDVIKPATMHQTRYDDVWDVVPNRARGYRRQQDVIRNTEYKDHGAFSAGGLLSTVDDLHRFVTALDNDKLLPVDLQKRMTTPVLGNYGLGWQVTRSFDRPVINHTGGIGGFSAHVAYYSTEELFVTVLSNIENEPVKAMACDLAALVFGTHQPILGQHMAADSDTSWFDLVIGTYVAKDGAPRTIVRQADHLSLRRGSTSLALSPLGFRKFALQDRPGVSLVFEGPPETAASAFTVQACGSVVLTARRTAKEPGGE